MTGYWWLYVFLAVWFAPLVFFAILAVRFVLAERRAEREEPGPVESAGETPMQWPDRYAGTRPRPHAGGRFGQDGNPRA